MLAGNKAHKLVTTVHVHVLTPESAKPLNIFKETLGNFPAVFVTTESGILSQNMIFFPNPNKPIFVPELNQIIRTALSQHEIENGT